MLNPAVTQAIISTVGIVVAGAVSSAVTLRISRNGTKQAIDATVVASQSKREELASAELMAVIDTLKSRVAALEADMRIMHASLDTANEERIKAIMLADSLSVRLQSEKLQAEVAHIRADDSDVRASEAEGKASRYAAELEACLNARHSLESRLAEKILKQGETHE